MLTSNRNPALPDVPTLAETVMPGFDILAWAGMFGPANMPPEAVKAIADNIEKALARQDVRERFNAAASRLAPLGYDERFRRLWNFYLAFSEAGFRERRIRDLQLLFAKPGAARSDDHATAQPALA